MLLFRHQYAVQCHTIKTAHRSFENVAQFKYFETTVTNQNMIHEEIKGRLNLGNACNHSVLLPCYLKHKD
jgi:hypothetical protein